MTESGTLRGARRLSGTPADAGGRNIVIVGGLAAAVVLLPPAIYAGLVWKQFGFLKITGFMPYEALKAAALSADVAALFQAPLISVNMTSGHLLSNMFELTLGQFVLSMLMAYVIAANVIVRLDLGRACATDGGRGGTATAAGSGMLATVGASSTGIMGCCGTGIAGGVLSLAGVGANTAAQISEWSTPIQLVIIGGIALIGLGLGKRLTAAA